MKQCMHETSLSMMQQPWTCGKFVSRRSVGKPKEKEDENESFPNINFYNYKDE